MTRFLCLLVLMGLSSCLSQGSLPPPYGCMNPDGYPGQPPQCLNGYLSYCSCTPSYPTQCHWIQNGIRCPSESVSPAKTSESLLPPYGYCSDPEGYDGTQKCIGGSMKVCYCMQQKPYQCNWFGAGKPCIVSGAVAKSSDSDKTQGEYCEYCPPKMPYCDGTCVKIGPKSYCTGACKASTSEIDKGTQLSGCSVLCPFKLAAAALICVAQHNPKTDPIGFASCLIDAAKSSGCFECVCDFICDHYPAACSACRSRNKVSQSGLNVALAIGDKTIDNCTFTITFNPNVCDNLVSVGGKVDEKNFLLPIDPENTRLCRITEILSKCRTLLTGDKECGPVTNPPPPPAGLNYVFEFQSNSEGCILVQQ